MNFKLALATLAVTAIALPAVAQTSPGNIDQRQANQELRIQKGEQSGTLTSQEVQKLEKREAHVDTLQTKAQADGMVPQKEQPRLVHAKNKTSRRIADQKHDRQHDFDHDGKNDRSERRQNRRNH